MHIFIDESGLFLTSTNSTQWSSVGALVIPDNSMGIIEQALCKLKAEHGLDVKEEFKNNRPDCSSNYYSKFLQTLKENKCTLHVASGNGSKNEEKALYKHKAKTQEAILNFQKKTNSEPSHPNEIISLIEKLNEQEYTQLFFQTYMIDELLNKVLSLYAQIDPSSLGSFKWKLDRKNITETRYEQAFKKIYPGVIAASLARNPKALMQLPDSDFSFFNNNFGNNEFNINYFIENTKNIFDIDYSKIKKYIQAYDLEKILTNDLSLSDSKTSFGLQIIDLLVSSVNRCLKRNFTNNEKMAEALGSLMINSSHMDRRAILIMNFSGESTIDESVINLIERIDEFSFKLFSDNFKLNFENQLAIHLENK